MILSVKKKWLIGLSVVLMMAGIGAYFAYNIYELTKSFSFNLIERLEDYDHDLIALNRACRRSNQQLCFDTVAARAAWTSSFDSEDFDLLERGCRSGDQRACRHIQRLNNNDSGAHARVWRMKPSPSKHHDQQAGSTWPRIAFLSEPLSYPDWLAIAYQGLREDDEQREVDLVCSGTRELPGAMVCAVYGALEANLALSRVAAVFEQGGRFMPAAEHRQSPLVRFWQGYDLQREDFEKAVAQISKTGERHPEEEKLWDALLEHPWKMLLTFNVFSVFSGIPSHEFLHGFYFESKEYRTLVSRLIDQSPLKLIPLKSFVSSLYKTDNSFVFNNEIQAYAMQSEPSFPSNPNWLEAVGVFKEPVRNFFSQNDLWRDFLEDK